jgi:hypothetical protein
MLKAAEKCQKIAKKHALMANSTIFSTLQQFRETSRDIEVSTLKTSNIHW